MSDLFSTFSNQSTNAYIIRDDADAIDVAGKVAAALICNDSARGQSRSAPNEVIDFFLIVVFGELRCRGSMAAQMFPMRQWWKLLLCSPHLTRQLGNFHRTISVCWRIYGVMAQKLKRSFITN